MLEFGKSYIVTLSESMIDQTGQGRWAIYGDFKGESEMCGSKYVQFGDSFIKETCIRFLARSDNPALGEIEDRCVTHDGEVVKYHRPSTIGRAHVRNG